MRVCRVSIAAALALLGCNKMRALGAAVQHVCLMQGRCGGLGREACYKLLMQSRRRCLISLAFQRCAG